MKKKLIFKLCIVTITLALVACKKTNSTALELKNTSVKEDLSDADKSSSEIETMPETSTVETEFVTTESIEESVSEIIVPSCDVSILSIAGEYSSLTSDHILSISIFSSFDEGFENWKGNMSGRVGEVQLETLSKNGQCLEIVQKEANIYLLCDCDYDNNYTMAETGYCFVPDIENETIVIYMYYNEKLVEKYKLSFQYVS